MNEKKFNIFLGIRPFYVFLACLLMNTFAYSQQPSITGKVTGGANSNPLSGVTVRVKDGQTATTTDDQGNFTINAPKGSRLVFTYVGYSLNEVVVGNSTNLEVNLESSTSGLDEVIVVGYGTRRKRDITSAVSTINMADIDEQPSRGITQLIQGQAPGVVVNQKDGRPTDKVAFRTAVIKERRVELAFENHRWFDLKRTMSPAELVAFMNAHGAREKANPTVARGGVAFNALDYVYAENEYFLPIPAPQILINAQLTQNQGY